MNLDELRSAQAKERRKDSLQHLRDSFYDTVAAYIADLRAARDRRAAQVDKPFSDDDVRRMSDEIETAEEVAKALYERRVGKVVKLASFAAADMPVEDEGMTTEERELFDDLVDRIGGNKSRVLDVLSGETPPSESGETSPSSESEATMPSAGADATDDSVSEEMPSSTEATPDAATSNVNETEVSDPTDSSALAGAMGGSESDTVSDTPLGDAGDAALDNAGDGSLDEASDVPAETPEPTGNSSHTDMSRDDAPRAAAADGSDGSAASAGTTEVPPEPAPPGAPDVEDSESRATDSAVSGLSARDDRTTVRITRDVGAILGVDDREYELASEDVVTLPAENADPLVQRDAAERLD